MVELGVVDPSSAGDETVELGAVDPSSVGGDIDLLRTSAGTDGCATFPLVSIDTGPLTGDRTSPGGPSRATYGWMMPIGSVHTPAFRPVSRSANRRRRRSRSAMTSASPADAAS